MNIYIYGESIPELPEPSIPSTDSYIDNTCIYIYISIPSMYTIYSTIYVCPHNSLPVLPAAQKHTLIASGKPSRRCGVRWDE